MSRTFGLFLLLTASCEKPLSFSPAEIAGHRMLDGGPKGFFLGAAASAGRAGAALGRQVDWWCTLNEPNVYVAKGYLAGQWPPGVKDPARAVRALAAFERAHGLMTEALRRRDTVDADGDGHATRIGI